MREADRIYRRHELPRLTGLGHTAREELMRRDEFPKPIKLSEGGRAIGWLGSEIAAWQASRKTARDDRT
jgi:prophage regulatory protein